MFYNSTELKLQVKDKFLSFQIIWKKEKETLERNQVIDNRKISLAYYENGIIEFLVSLTHPIIVPALLQGR